MAGRRTHDVEGGLINRAEFFDERIWMPRWRSSTLSRPAPSLENAASQVAKRFRKHFAAGSWDGMAARVAMTSHRRSSSGSGRGSSDRSGSPDHEHASDRRAIQREYDVDGHRSPWEPSCPFALRLFGTRSKVRCFSQRYALHHRDRRCSTRIVAPPSRSTPDDFEAAIAELDARYLAGEAAAHAHTWSSVIHPRGHAILNRRELPAYHNGSG